MSDAPLKNRENEGSVAVVAVVAVILKPITATADPPNLEGTYIYLYIYI